LENLAAANVAKATRLHAQRLESMIRKVVANKSATMKMRSEHRHRHKGNSRMLALCVLSVLPARRCCFAAKHDGPSASAVGSNPGRPEKNEVF